VTRPLVSAIVPVWNGERYLGEALDSILAQDYEPLETIVVDDGSTDGSADIARSRGIEPLVQANGGPAVARNAGIAASSGEIVMFLDQDDVWLPGKVRNQVEALAAHPEAGVLYGRMEVFLEPGTPWPDWLDSAWQTEPNTGFTPGTLAIRREALEAVGGFDPEYRVASDGEWLVRSRRAGIGSLVSEDLVLRYRVHGRNQSYDKALARSEMLRALRTAP
jgi:glycosyltransferase involved in cell wall biosynthesis